MDFEDFSNLERIALNIQALHGVLAECYEGLCGEYRSLARLSTGEQLGEMWGKAISDVENSAETFREIQRNAVAAWPPLFPRTDELMAFVKEHKLNLMWL